MICKSERLGEDHLIFLGKRFLFFICYYTCYFFFFLSGISYCGIFIYILSCENYLFLVITRSSCSFSKSSCIPLRKSNGSPLSKRIKNAQQHTWDHENSNMLGFFCRWVVTCIYWRRYRISLSSLLYHTISFQYSRKRVSVFCILYIFIGFSSTFVFHFFFMIFYPPFFILLIFAYYSFVYCSSIIPYFETPSLKTLLFEWNNICTIIYVQDRIGYFCLLLH